MKKLILFLSFIVTAAACKKDDVSPTNTTTPLTPLEARKKLLMEARWKLLKMETIVLIGGDSLTFDITTNVGCELDNLLEYHSSGFIKIHTGAITCYQEEPAIDTTKAWAMQTEQQIIETHLHNNYQQYWDIEVLNSDTLRISTGTVDTNGNQHNIITYTNAQ